MMKFFLYVFLSLICFGLSFYITPFIIKFINFIALALFDKADFYILITTDASTGVYLLGALVFNAFLMFVFAILCYFIYSKFKGLSFFGFVLFVLNVGRGAMPKRK
mgnify:CR=1 FL=1